MKQELRITNYADTVGAKLRFTFHVSRFTFYVLICLFTILIATPVAAQSTGPTIMGQVTNGTPDGSIPVGADVSLRFFSESDWTSIYTTTLAADGTFAFDELESEPGNDFVTHIIYNDVAYFSEPALLSEADITTEILIFETTDDDSTIQIDQLHLFIVPTSERVFVVEYYMIGNTGDRAYAGTLENGNDMPTTLHFSPPAGAENIVLEGGELGGRYIGTPESFFDTRAIPPGTATVELRFSYELPYEQGLTLDRTMDVPVTSAVFIVSSEDIGIEGPDLNFNGLMDTQMGPAASYTAGPLSAEQNLSFTFVPQTATMESTNMQSPTNPTPQPRAPRNPANELGIGFVTLALASVVSYLIWQPQSQHPMPEAARPLVAQIVALEAQLAKGDISEENHQQEQAKLKQHIKQIIKLF